ncbi:MAG: glycosyltransferase family 4 protein [Elusimicrobia bacterium]|nr:glycosyltransferase family 4 protein [Elusimicrobiota bacterium]
MVKVAHVITRLDFGGAQANTLHTVRTLDRSRFEPYIVCGHWGDLEHRVGDRNIVYAENLVREISPLKDLRAVFELRRILRERKPDIVHTHSSKAGILGRVAARAAGVPVIIHTFHGFGFHPRQGFLKRNLYIALEKFCARFSDSLVFVSEANMATARELGIGDPKKYALIRSGIALGAYPARTDRELKRAGLGLSASDTVIISIGNAKPQKNPGHFLEAAARLSKDRPSARFVFVGGGEELESLRSAAKERGLERSCLFTGWREDTAELLAASDVFALTSYWEGLPRALVEALRTGLPAVCYATDGVTDILKEGINGFPVPQGDLDAFCAALGRLLDDAGLRARLAAGAAATDLSDFDIDRMVRRQEGLYSSLLAAKGNER